MRYLSHLAEIGAANIHPYGRVATDCLIACLDPRRGQHLLEVGCGTAETMVRIALRERDAAITGVDMLPQMLRVARRRLWLTGVRGRTQVCLVQANAPLPFS